MPGPAFIRRYVPPPPGAQDENGIRVRQLSAVERKAIDERPACPRCGERIAYSDAGKPLLCYDQLIDGDWEGLRARA